MKKMNLRLMASILAVVIPLLLIWLGLQEFRSRNPFTVTFAIVGFILYAANMPYIFKQIQKL